MVRVIRRISLLLDSLLILYCWFVSFCSSSFRKGGGGGQEPIVRAIRRIRLLLNSLLIWIGASSPSAASSSLL